MLALHASFSPVSTMINSDQSSIWLLLRGLAEDGQAATWSQGVCVTKIGMIVEISVLHLHNAPTLAPKLRQ